MFKYNKYVKYIVVSSLLSIGFAACSSGPTKFNVPILGTAVTIGEEEKESGPTYIDVSFFASNNLNPSPSGKPTPVVVHVYELKSFRQFEDADFFALYDNPEGALGDSLLAKDKVQITPKIPPFSYPRELKPETEYVGFLAAYRDPDKAYWRALTEKLEPHKTNKFAALLETNAISLTKMQEDAPRSAGKNGEGIDFSSVREQLNKAKDGAKEIDDTHNQIKSLGDALKKF